MIYQDRFRVRVVVLIVYQSDIPKSNCHRCDIQFYEAPFKVYHDAATVNAMPMRLCKHIRQNG